MNQIRWIATLSMALLLVTPSSSAATLLVLSDGTTMEADAIEFAAPLVMVTLTDGRRIAFQMDEVNLEASGYAPESVPSDESKPVDSRSLLAAIALPGPDPTFVIENDDVAHIDPGAIESSTDVRPGLGTATDLKMAMIGVRHSRSASGVVVIGRVRNMESVSVEGLILDVRIIGENGRSIASGTTAVAGLLGPGAEGAFRLEFATEDEVKAAFAEVREGVRMGAGSPPPTAGGGPPKLDSPGKNSNPEPPKPEKTERKG
ncbi:MAG: hypothetical protein GY906_33890 [bacterium]|nr:hypothetical protein [bacterium]